MTSWKRADRLIGASQRRERAGRVVARRKPSVAWTDSRSRPPSLSATAPQTSREPTDNCPPGARAACSALGSAGCGGRRGLTGASAIVSAAASSTTGARLGARSPAPVTARDGEHHDDRDDAGRSPRPYCDNPSSVCRSVSDSSFSFNWCRSERFMVSRLAARTHAVHVGACRHRFLAAEWRARQVSNLRPPV